MAPRGRGQGGGRSGGRSFRSGGRWFPRSPWARIKREEDKTATSNSSKRSSMQIMADKVEQAYQAAKQERRQKLAAKKPRPLEKGEVIIISSDSDWDDEKAPPKANAKDESSTTTTFRVIKEQQLASASSTSAVPSPLPPDEEVKMRADAGMEGIEQAGAFKEEEQSKLEQQQPAKRKATAKKLKGAKLSIAEQNEYDRKRCNALPPTGKFLSQPKFLTLNPYAGVNEMRERDCFFNDHLQFLGEIPHSSLTELFVKYMKLGQ